MKLKMKPKQDILTKLINAQLNLIQHLKNDLTAALIEYDRLKSLKYTKKNKIYPLIKHIHQKMFIKF